MGLKIGHPWASLTSLINHHFPIIFLISGYIPHFQTPKSNFFRFTETEEKHNPAKLSNIDQLLTKFKGKEPTLYKSF